MASSSPPSSSLLSASGLASSSAAAMSVGMLVAVDKIMGVAFAASSSVNDPHAASTRASETIMKAFFIVFTVAFFPSDLPYRF